MRFFRRKRRHLHVVWKRLHFTFRTAKKMLFKLLYLSVLQLAHQHLVGVLEIGHGRRV